MIYCVVPRELEEELFDKLTAHYADDPNVTVIVDRRSGDRRSGPAGREGDGASEAADDPRRTLRSRRRRRVPGDFPPLP